MPNGTVKNGLYALALPVLHKKTAWSPKPGDSLGQIYHRNYTVGACFQSFQNGSLNEYACYGLRNFEHSLPVTENTWFRIASLTKTVVALLILRLQTLQLLDVQEDISAFWKQPIRNPYYPDEPITLGMLLSHTSSLCDSPVYFASYNNKTTLDELLQHKECFTAVKPGHGFTYSNFGAGLAASLLEYRFQTGIEQLIQAYLFQPLGLRATFDSSLLRTEEVADLWRIMPQRLCYSAQNRLSQAKSITEADPQHHYLLAAGQLMITAPMLGKLCTALFQSGAFWNDKSLACLKAPVASWPNQRVPIHHAMGLFTMRLPSGKQLWGHQGLAYGAVNGLFFDQRGNGFVSLTAGTNEQRNGHLCIINQQLIQHFYKEQTL